MTRRRDIFFRRNLLIGAALAAATAAFSFSAHAADLNQPEIKHVLDFVRSSSCTFIRNGSEHTAAEAADHIAMKAGYAGDKITDAATLIDLVGSKSSMTGRPYYVQCPGQDKIESGRWMHAELDGYRAQRSGAMALSAKP